MTQHLLNLMLTTQTSYSVWGIMQLCYPVTCIRHWSGIRITDDSITLFIMHLRLYNFQDHLHSHKATLHMHSHRGTLSIWWRRVWALSNHSEYLSNHLAMSCSNPPELDWEPLDFQCKSVKIYFLFYFWSLCEILWQREDKKWQGAERGIGSRFDMSLTRT